MIRNLIRTGAVCIAGLVVASAASAAEPDVYHDHGANPLGVKHETVCFSVHNPTDAAPITVTGTRFHHHHYDAQTPVVLLLHGAAETRQVFDGGLSGVHTVGSFARELARDGYLVITWDRVGYGDSPYVGPGRSGYRLNFNSYVEMTHEIVAQIHAGTYTISDSGCPAGEPAAFGSESVVLGGHSIGAGEVMAYATRYHDIAAAVPIAWNNVSPPASTGTNLFLTWVLPQALPPPAGAGLDYSFFFRPGASGVSDDCVNAFFWLPSALPGVPSTECANSALVTTPSGEFLSTNGLRTAVYAGLANVGPTPAFLAFAQFDRLVVGADNDTGDPDESGAEVAKWQAECNCDVGSYTQPDAGHLLFMHPSMPNLVSAITAWLTGHGLPGS